MGVTLFLAMGCHRDWRAVHVHLPLPDLVEPCPCQRVVPCRNNIRDRKCEVVSTVAKWISPHIPRVGGRTPALDRLDDFEDRVLRRRSIVRERDLTGASAVGGLALKGDGLLAVDGHDVPLRDIVDAWALLARPVGTGRFERVGVERRGAVGDRLDEFDVCMA